MPSPSLQHKRVRLTRALALFGAFVMVASIPFDWFTAPPWMLAEDVIGAALYAVLPLLLTRGYVVTAQAMLIVVSNAIVFGNIVLLGHDTGAHLVLLALCAMPFAVFDYSAWKAQWACVALSLIGFGLAETPWLAAYQAPNSPGAAYYPYSVVVTITCLVFCLWQTSRANAVAERALSDSRETAIYSAKMAALGEMAAGIAHEINNPVAAILLRVQSLRKKATDTVVATSYEAIVDTLNRITKIVEALRTFSRDATHDPVQPEPLKKLVQDAVELCAERFRQHDIDLRIDDIAPSLQVRCRGVQVSQILLNLLSNAHDAVEGTHGWVQLSAQALDGGVEIAVTDSGPGVPPQLRSRLMQPFFTTKPVGKGVGIGLSTSRGLAEANAGSLSYDERAPHTRFVLTVPRA